jgi:hypothetical protein
MLQNVDFENKWHPDKEVFEFKLSLQVVLFFHE